MIRPVESVGDGTCLIELTQGRTALIDERDARLVGAHNWSARLRGGIWYAITSVGGRLRKENVSMHRLIMGLKRGDRSCVDHINGDGLDNRRCNLRVANTTQNAFNSRLSRRSSSGLKGASRVRGYDRWRASIRANGVNIHLGCFATPEEAHAAYCEAAKRLHGEFARTE